MANHMGTLSYKNLHEFPQAHCGRLLLTTKGGNWSNLLTTELRPLLVCR